MEPLRPSPFGQRCKSAKLQRWRCEEAKAKVRRYNGDVRRCETTIASSPSHSRLRNSALSYLRPKGDSAKVEVAPSVHHPSLTFISQTLKHLTSRIHTLAFRICSGSSYTKNKLESRSHISLITCSNSYLTLNETELFTLLSTDRWVHHFTVVPRVLLSRMNSLLSIFLHK